LPGSFLVRLFLGTRRFFQPFFVIACEFAPIAVAAVVQLCGPASKPLALEVLSDMLFAPPALAFMAQS